MEKELSEIDQFKYMMYNGKLPKGKVTPLIKDIYEFMNDPVKMMKVKELKIERQLIEAKMKKSWEEGYRKGFVLGLMKGEVETFISTFYGEVDVSWVNKCNEDQLIKALSLETNNLTYEQFQKEVLS